MVKLSEALILKKTNAAVLSDIKNLNLWGSELDDVSAIAQMPNVEVLSLSVNRISELAAFSKCANLQELYLRKNEVTALDEVRHLEKLPALRVLWLCDNPCADHPDYRARVIKRLPSLQKLDHHNVADEERACALSGTPYTLPETVPTTPPPSRGAGGSHSSKAGAAKPAVPQGAASKGAGGKGGASSNVLYAVMALLGELDAEALKIVKTEVDQRLAAAAASSSSSSSSTPTTQAVRRP